MKNTLKSRIAILCIVGSLFVIPASNSFGDDFATSIGAGSKSVLFDFSGLAYLGAGAYDGGLGAKYFIMDPLALRVSIPFAYANQSVKANTANQTADGYNSGVKVGLSAGAEYHFLKTRVSPYAGGGFGILFGSTTQKLPTTSVTVGGTTTTTDSKTTNNSAGLTVGGAAFSGGTNFNIGAFGGIEFFILKELSLSAEYQLGYGLTAFSDQKITTVVTATTGGTSTTTTTTTTTKGAALNQLGISNSGALTLSFYF